MNLKPSYIAPVSIALFLLLLLALTPAMAQRTVYQGTRTTLEVVQKTGDTYQWELYSDPKVNFAVVQGNCPVTAARFIGGRSGPRVDVEWLLPGIYFYKVTARNATQCTNNLKIGMIKVIPYEVKAVIAGNTLIGACQQATLSASSSIGESLRYNWLLLDSGVTLTNQTEVNTAMMLSPSFTGVLPADFRVSLQVTNQDGKFDRDTITVRINALPVANINADNHSEKDGSMIVDGSVSKGIALNYNWYTSEGKITGPNNQPTAKLFGAGTYTLEVTDVYGCKSIKSFLFPIGQYIINANPDYTRTSWEKDTTIFILNNDIADPPLVPGSVRIITPPVHGKTKVNPDGSVVYIPTEKVTGRDQFTYEVCDSVNLCDSALVTIDIYAAGVTFPEGFSPNGDGQNEHLIFRGLEYYPQSQLYVYTRSGQLVYSNLDYRNDWDGKMVVKNQLLPTGTYYYILKLGGTDKIIKGFVYIDY